MILSNCGTREETLEPFGQQRDQPISPKGNQPWIFIGRTDAEAEAPILWPPHVKSPLIGKDPDAGKDWGQGEKWVTDSWMASPTQWTWVWTNSGRQWRTGNPGVPRSTGLQTVGHNWEAEQHMFLSFSFLNSGHLFSSWAIIHVHPMVFFIVNTLGKNRTGRRGWTQLWLNPHSLENWVFVHLSFTKRLHYDPIYLGVFLCVSLWVCAVRLWPGLC